jgi:hypothetical protein
MLLNGNQFNNSFPLLSLMSLRIETKNPQQCQQLRAHKSVLRRHFGRELRVGNLIIFPHFVN